MGRPADLNYYERGATTYFASVTDQRFGYYLYVPKSFDFDQASRFNACVLVHGTGRTPNVYRDLMSDFAEANNVILIAPLFPAGIGAPGDLAGYKFIEMNGVRYDILLLAMVAEVGERYQVDTSRFLAFGFSGGAHFLHRFFYLHPDRLLAASIGAPGMVTLIDQKLPWWRGIADLEQRFGRPLQLDQMRQVPVQMVVGAEDVETWEITIEPGSRFWMEGANEAGRTRIDRIRTLARSFEDHGIPVRLDLIPGIGHNGYAVLEPVKDFFAAVLRDEIGQGAAGEAA